MEDQLNGFFPLVSIVITSYNRAKWIGQCIESAMAQDYANLEIVICDDGSTDNSDQIIKKYLHDPRIKYTRNAVNIGMIKNFNKVFFELAKGKYVTQIGSDDYLIHPQFISKAVNLIRKYENISMIFAKATMINEETKETLPSFDSRYDIEFKTGHELFMNFPKYPYYTAGGVLYSLDHLTANDINFTGRITADIEMNLQLMLCGNVGFINEVVYVIRQHGANASGSVKTAKDLEYSYIELIKVIYNKAQPVISDKKALNKWYKKLITKNLKMCIYMIVRQRDRKQSFLFHKLMVKKYKKEYIRFILTNPKYLIKMLLNR